MIPHATLVWEGAAWGVDPREHFSGVRDLGPPRVRRQIWAWGEDALAQLPARRQAAAAAQLPELGEGTWRAHWGTATPESASAAEEVLARWVRGGLQPVPAPNAEGEAEGDGDWMFAGRRTLSLGDIAPDLAQGGKLTLHATDLLSISADGRWCWRRWTTTPEGAAVQQQLEDVRALRTQGVGVAGALGTSVVDGLWLGDRRVLRPACVAGEVTHWSVTNTDGTPGGFVPFGAMA